MAMSRIEQEKKTVGVMIRMYCRRKEGNAELCESCRELMAYAIARLDRCPSGERKTSCRKCPIHCYRKDMALKIKEVMRYAGPRMMLYHPMAAIRHLAAELRH